MVTVPAPNTMESEYEMIKLQLTNHRKQITQYNENKVKMFGFILHHCSEESRQIIKQRTDNFEDIEANQDVVQIWITIKNSHLTSSSTVTMILPSNDVV
jgi:hypothetical protein